eukprot:scaffold1153_cov94-Isochrysis_galbana.AAC.2
MGSRPNRLAEPILSRVRIPGGWVRGKRARFGIPKGGGCTSVVTDLPKLFLARTSASGNSSSSAVTRRASPCCTAQCKGRLPDSFWTREAPARAKRRMT